MKKQLDYDLADEIKSDGIKVSSIEKYGFIKKVTIIDDDKYLKDKNGTYISYEILEDVEEEKLINSITYELKKMIKDKCSLKPLILCYGIGNEFYSSDALGPKTIKKLEPTLHLNKKHKRICCLIPGVMGNTGFESARVAKAIIKEYDINLLIVIDSLITHNEERIFKVIQISDVGLTPGSGLNNNRKEITPSYLNIPVIAIGVATAFPSYAYEENLINKIETIYKINISHRHLNKGIKYYTPKDSEEEIEYFSSIIARAINKC